MLDDRREGSQRGLLGSLYAGIVIGLGSILRWTILGSDAEIDCDIVGTAAGILTCLVYQRDSDLLQALCLNA